MSENENAENHTIRLLQEMRTEQAQFRQAAEQRFNGLELVLGKVVDAVTAVAKTQEQHSALLMTHTEKLTEIQRSQNVMEKDMRGIRGRVERIEDHLGLVKA